MRKFAYIWRAHHLPSLLSPPPFPPLGGSDVHRASALSYSSHTVAPAVGGAIVYGRHTRSVARDRPAPGNCLAGTTFLQGAC